MPKAATAPTPTLSQVDFYRVCEWLKSQPMANVSSLEALTLQAAQHIGSAVPEDEMKQAMQITNTKEPAHWSEPTDPQAIMARELARIIKSLGDKPSPAFEGLLAKLLPNLVDALGGTA